MGTRHKEILCLCHDTSLLQVRRMLLEHFGYSVLSAASVEDAMRMAENHCPDMLLMDNSETGVDLEELARQVKELCPEVIVAMLSPYYYGPANGSSNAIDGVVTKDEGPDALQSQIADLFDEGGTGNQGSSRPA